MVRAVEPLSVNCTIAYFEAKALKKGSETPYFCIGITAKDNHMRKFAGKVKNSIGYVGTDIYCDEKKVIILSYR